MTTIQIEREIKLLKSFAISILGEKKKEQYDPKFVKDTLKVVLEKPMHTFSNKDDFSVLLEK